jgi:hypothetical protein
VRRRAPGEFDTVLFADYSGARSQAAQRRAIALWRKDRGRPARKLAGPFTRALLRERLLALIEEATRRGRRVLFGIDHQWSWPLDLWRAAGLADRPWREALGALVEGDGSRPPLGPAHAFPAAFNAWAGAPVFHARVRRLAALYGVPCTDAWTGEPFRLAERALPGTQPAHRLGGAGCVAGQTLVGLAELHRLLVEAGRRGLLVRAWPMEQPFDDGQGHLGAEIYPSFCRPPGVPQTDDADARAVCEWASRQELADLLDLRAAEPGALRTIRLEGWILGAPRLGPRLGP